MTPELEDALLRDFPLIYRNGLLDGGFACGDGWEPLIREMSARLEKIAARIGSENAPYVIQTKQKFGLLRCYAENDETGELQDVIDEYEPKSAFVCEECGARGTRQRMSGGWWIKTVCPEHVK